VVRTSGQVAGERPDPYVAFQTRAVLGRLDDVLAEAGTDKSRLQSAEVYLADMAEFPAMNAA
jgi:enamine deaminase RidA (YjgF/YER057c/UK114 family)